jgi:hypothetical protein
MKTGIIERLKSAKSSEERMALLAEGKKYQHASPKTKRRWLKLVFGNPKELNKQ